jgi:hypothetical protein
MRRYLPLIDSRAWLYRRRSLTLGAAVVFAGILAGSSGEARALPIRIAVFGFELNDFSAGAGIAGNPVEDLVELHKATDEARQLITRSGRYVLVDMSGADKAARSLNAEDDKAVQDRTLQHCAGCEAAIARDLGADQSFLGVVSRISRTEYVVRFQVRDAQTGRLILAADSDLRMGAVDSWYRGVAILVKDRLFRRQEGGPNASLQVNR